MNIILCEAGEGIQQHFPEKAPEVRQAVIVDLVFNFVEKFMEFKRKELEAEAQIAEFRAKIVEGEAKGESWIQRTWRPLTMLSFSMIVVVSWIINACNGQDLVVFPDHFWQLLKIGTGGYIGARLAEKISKEIPRVVGAIQKVK